MKVKYRGPATVVNIGGKEYRPGDTLDLSEGQLRVMATAPAGTGIHQFDFADEKDEAKVEESYAVNPVEEASRAPAEAAKAAHDAAKVAKK